MNQKNQSGFKKPSNVLYALALIILSFFTISPFGSASAQTMQTNQTSVYTRITSNLGGYMESLPNDYATNTSQKYPLLISLTGVGERGDGSAGVLEKVTLVGAAKKIKLKEFPSSFTVNGKSYSFIVISPQMAGTGGWAEDVVALIKYCKSKYRVDDTRIYLAGLSLGGVATWQFSTLYGNQIAAALLICPGVYANATTLKALADFQLPLWVTHNDQDNLVNPQSSVALVNSINNYTGVPAPPKALFTMFQKVGHDAWNRTFAPDFKQNGLNVYEWMLTKSRGSQPSPPAAPVLTANAGANQVITLPTNSATLDASGSKVTSGSITSYTWTKVSGPTAGTITLVSNGLQAKLAGLTEGVYKYQLTVKDSNGSTATATVTITVNAAVTAPEVVITGAGTITLPTNSLTLSGTSTKVASGATISNYKWSKYSGPSAFTIASPNGGSTVVKDLVAGTYVFMLEVNDSKGGYSSGLATVTVKPATTTATPPVAYGWGGTITLPTNSITVSGVSSQPSPGSSIVGYSWVKFFGPDSYKIENPSAQSTVISNLVEGTYKFKLTVTDKNGLTASTDVQVNVNPGSSSSSRPEVIITGGGSITLPTNSITLSGTSTKVASGATISNYKWSKYSGPSAFTIASPNGGSTVVKDLVAGTYVFMLEVNDSKGGYSSGLTTVTVNPASSVTVTPPVAYGWGGTITLPTNSITVSAQSSVPSPGSSIISYSWVKFFGPDSYKIANSTAQSTEISNLVEGTYKFKLTVTDKNGLTASTDVQVNVNPAPASPIAYGWGGTITLPTNSITVSAQSSVPSPGSSIVGYSWVKFFGPDSYKIANSTAQSTVISNLVEGTYKFKLTVTDKNGLTATTDVQVNVNAAAKRTISASTTDATALSNADVLNSGDLSSELNVKVSPNPVVSDLNLALNSSLNGKVSVVVYGLNGRSVLQQEFSKQGSGTINKTISLSKLPAGIYVVQVVVDGKYKKSLRIVKQ